MVDDDGRLRVTQAGFPVLDAVVADLRGLKSYAPKTLRRTGDRLTPPPVADAHHREAALVGAVGAEAKQPVDAGKARRIGQHFRREALPPWVRASAATSATAS